MLFTFSKVHVSVSRSKEGVKCLPRPCDLGQENTDCPQKPAEDRDLRMELPKFGMKMFKNKGLNLIQ